MDIDKIIAEVTQKVLAEVESQKIEEARFSIRPDEVAGKLEHSLLNPDTALERIIKGCEEAKKYRFANIVVSPYFVPFASRQLKDSGVLVCSAVGFPHGCESTAAQVAEIRECAANGADELDVSLSINAIKSGRIDDARRDLDAMVDAAKGRVQLKAIYEQGVLTPSERERALLIIRSSGVQFCKISNALTGKKAVVEDVKYVRSILGRGIGIKIDGGVKTLETAMTLFYAGADRIGLSASVSVAQEALNK